MWSRAHVLWSKHTCVTVRIAMLARDLCVKVPMSIESCREQKKVCVLMMSHQQSGTMVNFASSVAANPQVCPSTGNDYSTISGGGIHDTWKSHKHFSTHHPHACFGSQPLVTLRACHHVYCRLLYCIEKASYSDRSARYSGKRPQIIRSKNKNLFSARKVLQH